MYALKKLLVFIFLGSLTFSRGQINIIGHAMINNTPLTKVDISVQADGKTIKTLSCGTTNYFKLPLSFGKNYKISFTHPNCVTQFMEVLAQNVPEDKRTTFMTYEVDLPFFYKDDADIDTMAFKTVAHRVIFDGNRRMVDDSVYNNAFLSSVLKKQTTPVPSSANTTAIQITQLVGTFYYAGQKQSPVVNKEVRLIGTNNAILKTTHSNRYGQFVFSSVNPKNIEAIDLLIPNEEINPEQNILLFNEKHEFIEEKTKRISAIRFLADKRLENSLFTYVMGGKLILSNPRQKKFFAQKTVYLSNKRNTVIKKTTTNSFGAFVFENVKPDNDYFVGVDATEIKPGERMDLLNKEDQFIGVLDTLSGNRYSEKISSKDNTAFNNLLLSEQDMRMNVDAKLYGDNINNPLGKLKILLLNDQYEVIDSALTNDFGAFKFKYLPFLKRFYLSAENRNQSLDLFSNILVYSNEDNLIKVVTVVKGKKLTIKPIPSEIVQMKDVYMEDPWLDMLNNKPVKAPLVENIQFDFGQAVLLAPAKQTLDKVVMVLKTNPPLKLELLAHTDSKGSEADNLKLSEARAKAAVNYLMEQGIEASRLQYKGLGEKHLLNTCKDGVTCSEEQHAQNRRIEFKVIK